MGWTDWFSRNNPAEEMRPSVRDVTFDAGAIKLAAKGPDRIEWHDTDEDIVTAGVDRGTPDRQLTPWTLDGLRAEARTAAAARKGGIVSLVFDRANGVPIAKAISKFPDGMGHTYEGAVLIRFRDAEYRLSLQARERGTTGMREAMVSALLMQLGVLTLPVVKAPAQSAPIEGLTADPYDAAFDGAALNSLTDDERVDHVLPGHPLSKVRRWLDAVQQTLAVAPDLLADVVAPAASSNETAGTRHRIPAFAIGILFLQTGRPDLAEQYMSEGIPMRDGEPVPDTPRLGDTLILLGVAREVLGRAEDAAWAHLRAVRTFAATRGDDHPDTVRARSNLGRVYALLDRHAEAEPLLDGVIPVFEAAGNTSELAIAVNALGLVRQSQMRHADALVCFERALSLFEQLHGPDFGECATVLRNMARSKLATGDRVGGTSAVRRAEGIERKQA